MRVVVVALALAAGSAGLFGFAPLVIDAREQRNIVMVHAGGELVTPLDGTPPENTKAFSVTNGGNTHLVFSSSSRMLFARCLNKTSGVAVYIVNSGDADVTNGVGPYCDTCVAGPLLPPLGDAFLRSDVAGPADVRCGFVESWPAGMPISSPGAPANLTGLLKGTFGHLDVTIGNVANTSLETVAAANANSALAYNLNPAGGWTGSFLDFDDANINEGAGFLFRSHGGWGDTTGAEFGYTLSGQCGACMGFRTKGGGGALVQTDDAQPITFVVNSGVAAQFLAATRDFKLTSAVELATGSAGSPSLTFGDHTTTGLFEPAANDIGFSFSGAEHLRCSAGGCTPVIDNDFALGDDASGIPLSQVVAHNFRGISTGGAVTTIDYVQLPRGISAAKPNGPACAAVVDAGKLFYADNTSDGNAAAVCLCAATAGGVYAWASLGPGTCPL